VSFNSKQDEGQRISQLSGGQKSLVALATGKLSVLCYMNQADNQYLQFKNVILHLSIYSTRLMLLSIPNIEQL
jgi:hypothetical protein